MPPVSESTLLPLFAIIWSKSTLTSLTLIPCVLKWDVASS